MDTYKVAHNYSGLIIRVPGCEGVFVDKKGTWSFAPASGTVAWERPVALTRSEAFALAAIVTKEGRPNVVSARVVKRKDSNPHTTYLSSNESAAIFAAAAESIK